MSAPVGPELEAEVRYRLAEIKRFAAEGLELAAILEAIARRLASMARGFRECADELETAEDLREPEEGGGPPDP